jgi:hypothetical protein
MDNSTARVRKIRSTIQAERALISALTGRLTDPKAKALVKPASDLLTFAELGFLDQKILQVPRSPAALSGWLAQAEKFLRLAVEHREYVEGLASKLGPDMKVFP